MSMHVSGYLKETCGWIGDFREFFLDMGRQDKIVYNHSIPLGPDDNQYFDRLQFSGFSDQDFRKAHKLLEDGTTLLETFNLDRQTYLEGEEGRLLGKGIASMFTSVGFLAVKLFDYGDTIAVYDGDAAQGDIRDEAAFQEFRDRFRQLLQDSQLTAIRSRRKEKTHQPDPLLVQYS